MKRFTTLSSITMPLDRANIDTDAIIPKQFLKSIKRSGFGPNLFDEWRYLDHGEVGMDNSKRPINPDFVLNNPKYKGAQILLTRRNFGCGSSREHAPWALEDFGFRAIIAPSFADIFYNNCFKNGILPIVLSSEIVDALFGYQGEIVINLEEQTVKTEDNIYNFEVDAERKGQIISKNPPEVLLEVGGIGYELLCPMSTFYQLDNSTEDILLYTHLSIKEDSHTLFGFISKDEKNMFRELIRVNGVGPKVALAILSHLSVSSLVDCIINEDADLLAKTPGIGKKTALKLIVELQDRLDKVELLNTSTSTMHHKTSSNPNAKQALAALQSLGFKLKEANKMISAIDDQDLSTEQLIRLALQNK